MSILEELDSLKDEDYKKFNSKIIPTNQVTLGVRLPILKNIAKRIAKENPKEFIQLNKDIYEMILLEGFVISYLKESFLDLLPETENYLEKVDNWAQIDSFILNFKRIKKEKSDILNIVRRWLKSDDEFIVRAGLITLLGYYIEKEDLNLIFNLSNKITHKGYYVFMGNAWLISTCMAKYPKETILFFENNKLDDITHNKAIQKSCESNRVSKKDKETIKKLKRS